MPAVKKPSDFGKEKEEVVRTSFLINDSHLIEQIYNQDTKESSYAVWDGKNITIEKEYVFNGVKHKPIEAEEIQKKAILLPNKAEEYGSDEKLDEEIKVFVNKWLDIPEDVMQFAIWNIKRSWVYERFHTLNYLRALGDTGMGKTRFLDTLGAIHYKPISTSGATTSAPVFRIINKWKGTLIMDEADFKQSDESQDIIKIINQGYEKGKFVMRCDQVDANKIDFFDPYCPKILATRKTFKDKAVESRCITQVMKGTNRKDIVFNLNDDFWEEAQIIRNKLLMWRFKNFFKIDPNKVIDLDTEEVKLEPRVKQIVSSFISLFAYDEEQLASFRDFIIKHQESLIDERRNSFAGAIVVAIYDLLKKGDFYINASNIVDEAKLTNQKGDRLHPRALTSTLKSLGFGNSVPKKVDGKTKRCLSLSREHLANLFERFGYAVTDVTVITETPEFLNELENNGKSEMGGGHRIYRNNSNQRNHSNWTQTPKTHLLCTRCGSTPINWEFRDGKPYCNNCKENLEMQEEEEQKEETKEEIVE